ncbi:MAG: DUF6502 family protein [Burkholderiaceae bacterium]|jgi:hypothetical protein|nr:DUF6502 family protein [Burkholderiaceae bacterium]
MPERHDTPETAALLEALRGVLVPLARLAVAHGVAFGTVEQLAKQAFVAAAREAHEAAAQPHRMVSRIATATGLTRREVARLLQAGSDDGTLGATRSVPRTHANEVFARWMSDPRYRGRGGPRSLPRAGEAPSFEALAQSVTRDVHPRSLLDELIRLGLARHDEKRDRVRLCREAFVPHGDAARMLELLGSNVGDHLAGAVQNVLGTGNRHFEQALFADGLSSQSLERLQPLISAQWRNLRASLVPAVEAMLEADRAQAMKDAAHSADSANGADARAVGHSHRVRIGLYTYDDAEVAAAHPAAGRPRRIRRTEN